MREQEYADWFRREKEGDKHGFVNRGGGGQESLDPSIVEHVEIISNLPHLISISSCAGHLYHGIDSSTGAFLGG